MCQYLTKNQINELLRKLNTCYPHYFRWSQKKARKKHIGLFGYEIKEGDYYYRAKIDNNYSNDLKLSRQSMEQFLYAIFMNVPFWMKEVELAEKKKIEDIRNIMDRLRPLE